MGLSASAAVRTFTVLLSCTSDRNSCCMRRSTCVHMLSVGQNAATGVGISKAKVYEAPWAKLNSCIPNMPCTALAVLSASNMHRARLVSLTSSELLTRSTTRGQMLSYPSRCTSLHWEALLFEHLQPACTSAEGRTFRGNLQYCFSRLPRVHL